MLHIRNQIQEAYTYQILKKCNAKIVIQLDEQLLSFINTHLTMKPQQKQKEVLQTVKKFHNFQRRIVPFFMNQFMHWAKEMGQKQVDSYLSVLHKKKLQSNKNLNWEILRDYLIIQMETRNKWIDFLSTQADICVFFNTKIKDQSSKQFYIKAIEQLKVELKKELPYDKFLSIPKIEESIDSPLEESQE